MGNSITQKLKYKQSVIKFSFKYVWQTYICKTINKAKPLEKTGKI